jgi:hypothetical protein
MTLRHVIEQLDHSTQTTDLETDDETMITNNRSGEPIFTHTGHAVVMPSRYDDYAMLGMDDSYKIKLTEAKEQRRYYDAIKHVGYPNYNSKSEFGLIGAVATGFTNTHELHVMTNDQAMRSDDKEHWEKSVDKEHNSMEKHKVFQATSIKDLPKDAKILTSTWACKKKPNGVYRARVTARGYEQIDGIHYNEDDKAAPVVMR